MVEALVALPHVRGKWIPMSYQEFLAWAPDDMRTEWTEGEGIIYVSTSDRHQWTIILLSTVLGEFVRVLGLGRVITAPYPAILKLDGPHREPDIMFVANERLAGWTHQRFHGGPNLIIEVLSEDTATEDQTRKRRQYQDADVQEYLMVESRPGRFGVTYLRLDETRVYQDVAPDREGRLHSTVVPGFWIDPAWFAQEPLPSALTLLGRISPEVRARLIAELTADG